MPDKLKRVRLKMTVKQHSTLVKWLSENGIDLDGKKEFGLYGQPSMHRKEIDVVIISPKQFNFIHQYFVKEGLLKGESNLA